MKLIDEKKFMEEASKSAHPSDGSLHFDLVDLEQLLSKHLKDLPKKVYHDHKNPVWRPGEADAYNQCLEDCEVK